MLVNGYLYKIFHKLQFFMKTSRLLNVYASKNLQQIPTALPQHLKFIFATKSMTSNNLRFATPQVEEIDTGIGFPW